MISLKKYWHEANSFNSHNSVYGNFSDKMDSYIELFLKWNRAINLSSARDQAAIAEHVADCFYLVAQVPADAKSVLDVGAGGGLPGVVLAIARPDTTVLSLEPVNKKQAFLRTCARELKLANYDALPLRLEDHSPANYDVAVSRATWDISEWLDMGLARVRPGGIVLGMEGARAVALDGFTVRHTYDFLDKTRAIIARQRA
ncbi:MAG: 16S rRNA (guanine(527)-N(7))-methyltransferase RsmG [Kofleriaceae bacterium]|nr:16S rRNA (guanine(527)-N(7))-methyltransferase RsmG [Kofleriaceae bacterium]